MNVFDFAPYFDVVDVSPNGWSVRCNLVSPNKAVLEAVPDWPVAALPGSGRAGSGRGLSHTEALASGLGSAFELACACRWSDLKTRRAPASDLEGTVWDAALLSGFSQQQLAEAAMWNAAFEGLDTILAPSGEVVDWVHGLGPDGSRIWLPADAVYISDAPDGVYAVSDTNGCAAGESAKDARSTALFELIERDATGRWWYGKRARPALPPSVLSPRTAACVEECSDAGVTVRVIDITSDIGVPCVASVGVSPSGQVACGFAAAACYELAATKAVTEMAQMYLVIQRGHAGAVLRPGLIKWLNEVTAETPPLSRVAPTNDRVPKAPTSIGTRLSDAGVRLAFVDLGRPEFGVPVWRAVSPDLCHWKPRFGRNRLLQPDRNDIAPVAVAPNDIFLRL